MEHIIALAMIVLIIYFQRSTQLSSKQQDSFLRNIIEEQLHGLSREVESLSRRVKLLEESRNHTTTKMEPVHEISSFRQIQQDWQAGAEIAELCKRYQLLQGEVDLIIGLIDKEGNQ